MRNHKRLVTLVIVGALLGGVVISLGASAPRLELTVTARGMAFYVGDDPRPNPALVLASNQRVRLTFVNEDRGVLHDLTIGELGLATDALPGDGSRQTIVFRTPKAPLSSSYTCSQHVAMMTAALEVR